MEIGCSYVRCHLFDGDGNLDPGRREKGGWGGGGGGGGGGGAAEEAGPREKRVCVEGKD